MTTTNPDNTSAQDQILIVDDDPQVLSLLDIIVRSFGFACEKANNGREALEILREKAFSIVITDMEMPIMSGMELLQQIKSLYPRTSVIVITGYTNTFSYVDVIRNGASDFIQKPLSSDELEAKIRRILRERDMIDRLEFLSNSDPLTELFNRRYLDKKIREEVNRADRQGFQIFLTIIDVDNFKSYNDQYGHQKGDQLLILIADILRKCTREDVDLVFRHGGDEFALLTPYINREQLGLVGERILAIYNKEFHGNTGLSLGVARFVRGDGSLEDDIFALYNRADKALYKAKNLGRNQLVYSD